MPASVTVLTLGSIMGTTGNDPRWPAFSAAASKWQDSERWRLLEPLPSSELLGEEEKEGQLASWISGLDGIERLLPWFGDPDSDIDCPLLPGLLPKGLRLLRLSSDYNQPIQRGSLPFTLTFLQLGERFD